MSDLMGDASNPDDYAYYAEVREDVQAVTRRIVIDVETTGLSPTHDRICSLAALELIDGESGEYRYLVFNPDTSAHWGARKVHGLDDGFLAIQDRFADHASDLKSWIGYTPLIAHNLVFDQKFLNAEFRRAGLPPTVHVHDMCTMKECAQMLGRSPSLRDTLKAFGIPDRATGNHDAYEDVVLTGYVFAHLFYEAGGFTAPTGTCPQNAKWPLESCGPRPQPPTEPMATALERLGVDPRTVGARQALELCAARDFLIETAANSLATPQPTDLASLARELAQRPKDAAAAVQRAEKRFKGDFAMTNTSIRKYWRDRLAQTCQPGA